VPEWQQVPLEKCNFRDDGDEDEWQQLLPNNFETQLSSAQTNIPPPVYELFHQPLTLISQPQPSSASVQAPLHVPSLVDSSASFERPTKKHKSSPVDAFNEDDLDAAISCLTSDGDQVAAVTTTVMTPPSVSQMMEKPTILILETSRKSNVKKLIDGCTHNRRGACKDCGVGYCTHGRVSSRCRECGTGYCTHNRQAAQCKLCGTGNRTRSVSALHLPQNNSVLCL
jgi:hypothetical protein